VFLTELTAYGHVLEDCSQADLHRWFATASRTEKNHARPFLTWTIRRHLMRGLRLPPTVPTATKPISQTRRLTLIRRVHDDENIPLQDRVVALLILLYAQPLTKIARLNVADIVLDGGDVLLRLGYGDPVPIVPPSPTCCLTTSPPDRIGPLPPTQPARCCSPVAVPANPSTPDPCGYVCTASASRTSTAEPALSAS